MGNRFSKLNFDERVQLVRESFQSRVAVYSLSDFTLTIEEVSNILRRHPLGVVLHALTLTSEMVREQRQNLFFLDQDTIVSAFNRYVVEEGSRHTRFRSEQKLHAKKEVCPTH